VEYLGLLQSFRGYYDLLPLVTLLCLILVEFYKKVPTVENVRQLCEELFLLKCIFCWLALQLYYKMWSSKSKILRINCRVGGSWHAAYFCNLNLTFISYSFWNTRRKVLKFKTFDEKRAITPRCVITFTSQLQDM
jgi:hypothetical protein